MACEWVLVANFYPVHVHFALKLMRISCSSSWWATLATHSPLSSPPSILVYISSSLFPWGLFWHVGSLPSSSYPSSSSPPLLLPSNSPPLPASLLCMYLLEKLVTAKVTAGTSTFICTWQTDLRFILGSIINIVYSEVKMNESRLSNASFPRHPKLWKLYWYARGLLLVKKNSKNLLEVPLNL